MDDVAVPWSTIPELLDDAARRFPEVEALVEGDVRWTYAELAERAHEMARAIIASGVEPGDRIGLWAPNIREWVVAALGAYGVGACLVPVNTRFKGREARDVLSRARVRLLFTVTDFLEADYVAAVRDSGGVDSIEEIVVLHGPVAGDTVLLDDFLARASSVDDATRVERSAGVRGDDICHILFTSGTTGAPKGAMLAHAQICRAYLVFADFIGVREGDRYLIVLPFFHSFGLHAGILCCLMKGATIYPIQVFEPGAVMRFIEAEGITAFPGAPAMYQAMLNHPDADTTDFSSLRLAILGAAAIPVELVEGMRGRFGIESVVTGYGITEGSGIVTMCHFDDPPEVISETDGRPLPGLEVQLIDETGDEVPDGEPGELLVRGYTVMRGYLDDPEQTAATIVDGWLHTGDVAVRRADGNISITDRLKDMYVVGGFNAYPAEIENMMLAHPHVGGAAVVGIPDDRLGEVGVAFVIPRPGTEPDPDEIIAWCRAEMANYKVPRAVEIVDAFPLNASGKVLKYELRERAATRRNLTPQEEIVPFEAPETMLVEQDGPVTVVTMNNPEMRNAFTDDLHDAMQHVWEHLGKDPECRAAVLTGAGRAFSAGGNVPKFIRDYEDPERRRQSLREAKALMEAMATFHKPLIAAVNGPAVGLGCSVAVSCDIVLIADTAFIADTHVNIGLVAGDGGAVAWPLMMSLLKAKEYLFTGDRIPAEMAVTLGLANRVVPADDLMAEARALAHRLAAQPAQAIQETKRALNLHLQAAIALVAPYALSAESESFATEDLKNTIDGFRKMIEEQRAENPAS